MAQGKAAEIRREEILDAAAALFAEKGYVQTSTGDIMNRVGIAKGTLYYHFSSKEEILDALLEAMGRRLLAEARSCAGQKDVPVFARMLRVLLSLNARAAGGGALLAAMHQPGSELLHEKAQAMILREAGPILSGLVREGNAQGVCDCRYPEQAVEMVMLYVLYAFDEGGEQAARDDTRTEALIANLEQLFGTAPGAFAFVGELLAEQEK